MESQQAVVTGAAQVVAQGGLNMLPAPVKVLDGTTTAVTTKKSMDVSKAVPPAARVVFTSSEIRVSSGGGGMRLWAVGSGGGAWCVDSGLSGADGFLSCSTHVWPVVGGALQYMVTDESGGGTTTNWVSYKVWVTGWA